MAYEIIQDFLRQNLLDLGEDESRWEHLTTTADAIRNNLIKTRWKVAPYLLTALDSDCPADEPIFEEVEELLMQRWRLLRQRFAAERPRQILRSIILQALHDLVREDHSSGCVVWLCGSSYVEHAHIPTATANIIGMILSSSQQAFSSLDIASDEKQEIVSHEIDQDGVKSDKDIQPESVENATEFSEVNSKDFRNRKTLELIWASFFGYSYQGGNIPDKFRPVEQAIWDDIESWADEFPPRVASFFLAFSKHIEKVIKQDAQSEFQSLLRRLTVEEQAISIRSNFGVMRQSVLWWKHSLFSPKLRLSYRQLDSPVAAICMAIDLSDMLPAAYPISVDFVLAETVADLLRHSDRTGFEKSSLGEILSELNNSNDLHVLDSQITSRTHPLGRGTLMDFVEALIQRQVSFNDLQAKVGCSFETEINVPEFSVWLFRNLQARKFDQTLL